MLLVTNKTIDKLKHDLVREGLVDIDGLLLAQENAQNNDTNLADELIKKNIISEEKLLKFIEDKLHIPSVDLDNYTPDINCLSYISYNNAKTNNIFPLFKIEDVLTVAMADPIDLFAINKLFELNSISIEPVVCSISSIQRAIDYYYLGQKSEQVEQNWQDELLGDNISDEGIDKIVNKLIYDAINQDSEYILMESSQTGLNIFFNKKFVGFIPSILVQRFIYSFKNIANLDTETSDVAQRSKFIANACSLFASVFPTKYGLRISIQINKPLKPLSLYAIKQEKIDNLIKEPALIGIVAKDIKEASLFAYSLAEYLSAKYSILFVENEAKYELNGITQIEFHKNTGVYFDELLSQIDYQNFEIIFWEKIYNEQQAQKLKLFSREKIVFTALLDDNIENCDFLLYTTGEIK